MLKCESRVVNTPVDLFIKYIEIEKYLNYYWNVYFLGNLNKIHLGQSEFEGSDLSHYLFDR